MVRIGLGELRNGENALSKGKKRFKPFKLQLR
jgi:hypothetical protein